MADEERERIVDRDGAARCVFAVRRMMKDAITAELVLNPAVDMLFALYLGRGKNRPMSRAEVCESTGAGHDVCRHWALALVKSGLVVAIDDGYRLSDEGHRIMDHVNEQVWDLAHHHMGVCGQAG